MNAESVILSIAAIAAGAVASVTGFGIGSILTPTLSLWMDGRIAGSRLLKNIPEGAFRKVVAAVLALLGSALLWSYIS